MNLSSFTNSYPVSKTLRFKLNPVGKTLETIEINQVLEQDESRAQEYKKAKKIIDRYHIAFIEKTLSDVKLDGVDNYIELCQKKNKTEEDIQELQVLEVRLRCQIANHFSSQPEFKSLFGKELITELLPNFIECGEEQEIINHFSKFFTAFYGFNENRKNIYTSEPIPTAISYRCINDNLPKFISNINCFEIIRDILEDQIMTLDGNIEKAGYSMSTSMCFSKDTFSFFLAQSGIDAYNAVIGGWVTEEGIKVQGLNEYINLYNQQLDKTEKNKRLPKFQILYKQILTESDSFSFYQEGIKDDSEFLSVFKKIFADNNSVYNAFKKASECISKIEDYNPSGIFISNGLALTSVSKGSFGEWNAFNDAWSYRYNIENPVGKMDLEKYEKKMSDAFKKIPSFSIQELNTVVCEQQKKENQHSVEQYFKNTICSECDTIQEHYEKIRDILNTDDEVYVKTDEDTALIKNFLDAVKDLERSLGYLKGCGTESDRDEVFYGEFSSAYDCIRSIDSIYDLIRNYVTKKPYTTDKYKLYFNQSDFMSGWDAGGNGGKRCSILIKDGKYYLMIGVTNSLPKLEVCDSSIPDYYEKVDYRLLTGANKMLPKVIFSKAHINEFCPDNEIMRIKTTETFKKGPQFSPDDCHKLIGFYQDCIYKSDWGEKFGFKFKSPSEYEDISKFFREIETQGYRLVKQRVDSKDIDSLVEEGKVYLFQIYNKDFSEYSHGKPNLHTMFFKALFDENNQSLIKLNGGAELFMRRASIKEENKVIHPAGTAVASKNAINPKRSSTFDYDLIKDRRYTVDQFEFHVPIQLNWVAPGNIRINDRVREALRNDPAPYVIGIDRGERNLLYICVIDQNGKIIEQCSLNSIVNEYNGISYETDYHRLLDQKETERKQAKQNWTAIENIKELKDGYISQVVHKICQLIIKYNAVVALEDLNSGFKRGRTKVEKQVYQKFEKALIDKLNYMSDKNIDLSENGSILHGYQLSEKFDSFSRMRTQNGILFYIPAWLTSKIDPVTGFADLLKPKYESIEASRKFIMSFDSIIFSEAEDMFVFDLDYTNFPRTEADFNKQWKLYTNGSRIKTFRNPAKNSEWDYKEVCLTTAMKELLDKYSIKYADGTDIRDSLVKMNSKDFYIDFIDIVKLMLQLRNSISGRTDVDYLISPVKSISGEFYDSRKVDTNLPIDADANGAYNIARKVLWAIEKFKGADIANLSKTKIAISNKEWLAYAQK